MTQQPTETPTGIEAIVCDDIAERQRKGIAKYGVTVADNPLTASQWVQHGLEESLDLAVYLKKLKIEIEKLERELTAARAEIALLKSVAHFALHSKYCAIFKPPFTSQECDCGYSKALAALESFK